MPPSERYPGSQSLVFRVIFMPSNRRDLLQQGSSVTTGTTEHLFFFLPSNFRRVMQDFPANSAKVRAQSEGPQQARPERIERITSAEADRRRVPLGRKFKDVFIGGTARDAIMWMVEEAIIPQIQDTLVDAFQGGFERLIKGNTHRSYRSRYSSSLYSDNPPRVNYQGMSMNRSPTSGTRMLSRRARARQDFDEIVIESRAEAHEVLDRMYELLDRYGQVTVSDLYEMTGIASSHTDHRWGWTALPGAKIGRLRDGRFVLDLPEPKSL